MADAIVDGDAGGEGDTFSQLLILLESFASLLSKPLVTKNTKISDTGRQYRGISKLLQDL